MRKPSKAPKPYKAPKISVARYVFLNVALPLLMVFVVIVVGFVINGLFENYLNKKAEVRRMAKIIAHTAALENFNLVSELVSESINHDPVLSDIHFYPIENQIKFDDYVYDDWHNALLNPSVSFYEGVMVSIDEQVTFNDAAPNRAAANKPTTKQPTTNQPTTNQPTTNQPTTNQPTTKQTENEMPKEPYRFGNAVHGMGSGASLSDNTVLVGYINMTIDLDALRKQWFKRNLLSLLSLPAIALSFLSLVYLRMRLPTQQVIKMSNKAKRIMAQDSLDLGPMIHSEKGFDELETIRLLMVKLDYRYKEVVQDFNAYKQTHEDAEPQCQIKTHETNLRSMIIHGLKSSLNTVLDGQRLLDNHYVSKEQAEAVAAIHKGSKELDDTLNQIILLDLIAKGLVGVSLNELQPAQLLNNLIQDYQSRAADNGLKLSLNVHHVDHVLAGDVQKIRSILGELLSNAINYTNAGSVTIDSRMDYFAETIRWTVRVKDTGVGIEQKHMENIFEPFFHGNPNIENASEGLGLGVAKRLTQLLGGDLSVASDKGKGSTFTLVLQLKDWRYDEMYRMLKGVNIAGLASENTQFGPYIKNLETYGATVHTFLDSFAIFEYIAVNSIDILLIADGIGFEEVKTICLTLRQQEANHRILIAWYGTDITPHTQAMLEAVGLDYVLDPTTSFKEQATAIKSWAMT